ncbi:MAG: hypothetical protein VX265_05190 [Myxococcota bacterium]|nr:hypothetical protein [Myxococcota bacterium]
MPAPSTLAAMARHLGRVAVGIVSLGPGVGLAGTPAVSGAETTPSASADGIPFAMPRAAKTISLSRGSRAASFRADLDGDARPDRIGVRFQDDGHVRVDVTDASGRSMSLDLGRQEDMNGVQKTAAVHVTSAAETGIPLVVVRWEAGEYCGSGTWFAYGSLVDGQLKRALVHPGEWSDSPVSSETVAMFDPAHRTVELTRTVSNDDDASSGSTTQTRHVLEGGVFVPQGAD